MTRGITKMKPLKKNKKGAVTDLFIIMIVIFTFVVVLGALFYIYIVMKPRMDTALLSITDEIPTAQTDFNNTFGQVGVALQNLPWISVMLIIGVFLAFLITSFLVNTHPIFFVAYIFVIVIAVVVSVPLANTYEILYTNPMLSASYSQFQGASLILSKLPIVIAVIGFIGAIILFSRLFKQQEYSYY